MRTFVQAASHHFQLSVGSGSLSFNVIDTDTFRRYLKDEKHSDDMNKLFWYWERTVTHVALLIKRDLNCDSYQFMPETASLVPVFQLLLSYPELLEPNKCPGLVAYFILMLLLSGKTQQQLLADARSIASSPSLGYCAGTVCGPSREPTGDQIGQLLKASNSLQHRYTLLLYWLERKKHAKDFQYDRIPEAQRKQVLVPSREVDINAACHPEKQHIVLYSWLQGVFDLQARGGSAHIPLTISETSHTFRRP